MMTTRMGTKRYLTLLAGLFVFNLTFAQQQNFLGFTGSKAELQNVQLMYFKNGQPDGLPDDILGAGGFNTYQIHQWGFDKINSFIYESVRFLNNKFMVSNASMQESEMDVKIIEPQKGNEKGKVMLSWNGGEYIEATFQYDGQTKTLLLQYTVSEWDNIQYIEERDQKIADGLFLEVQEYEQTTTPGIYIVSVNYLIK